MIYFSRSAGDARTYIFTVSLQTRLLQINEDEIHSQCLSEHRQSNAMKIQNRTVLV